MAKRDNTMTKRFLCDAGITEGMRVIELGCGNGEVTQLLAELVGSSGFVVAIDSNEIVLATAQGAFISQNITNVKFVCADVTKDLSGLDEFSNESFDALTGRRILMYLKNPAEVIRGISGWLRKGGVVVFEEADSTMTPASIALMPAHHKATEWIKAMLLTENASPSMGLSLPSVIVQAGVRFEKIRGEAIIQGQGTQFPLSTLLKLVQTRLVSSGIVTVAEMEALIPQLDVEDADPTNVFVSMMSFCAWGQKP